MVTIQNKILKHTEIVDYEVWISEYKHELWDVLEISDVVDLYNHQDSPPRLQATMERTKAEEAVRKHPNIFDFKVSNVNTNTRKGSVVERQLQRRQYEQTASEMQLENIREATYKQFAEARPINTPIINNDDEKAITLFEAQKNKIDAFPNNEDEFWRNETLGLVEKFIGKESSHYGLLSSHTFWPNPNAINIETAELQRERGRKMIDLCISHIKAHGVKKEPLVPQTVNYHYNFPESTNPVINTIQNSSLNNLSNFDTHTNSSTNAKTPTKTSWIEVVYWILGILVSVGLLYEFVIKNIVAK